MPVEPALFACHSGQGLLAILDSVGPAGVKYATFKIAALREAGWKIDEIECARTLPRLDAPQIQLANGPLPPARRRH